MEKLNYKDAGVDIEKADALTEILKETVNSDNIGLFAGIYDHPYIPDYYLAACTDGVGTKVIPLVERGMIDTIATDLIAMNLNDLICVGAAPMFFLDYFATSKLDVEIASKFVISLKNQLAKYNCMLLGGETAELKNLIKIGHFDVAGFSTGIVKKYRLLTSLNVKENDVIIGLEASSPHSNGYTLIRKLYETCKLTEEEFVETLKPTNIYVNEVIDLVNKDRISAAAHITGGGIEGNLCRAIPDGLCAEVFKDRIPQKEIFKKLEALVGTSEAYKTFNMGVGLCLITSTENVEEVIETCQIFNPFVFGIVRAKENEESGSVWLR